MRFPQENYPQIIPSCTTTPRKLISIKFPQDNCPRDFAPRESPPIMLSSEQLDRFGSKLHLSEGSIATEDPSKVGTVNPLAVAIFYIFSLVLSY